MKKFILSLIILSLYSLSYSEDYASIKEAIQSASKDATKTFTDNVAPVMQFHTGSGNMSHSISDPLPFVSFGIGVGITLPVALLASTSELQSGIDSMQKLDFTNSTTITNSVNKIIKLSKYLPMPYDTVYFKLGIIPSYDIGLRYGFLPTMSGDMSSIHYGIGGIHLGGEVRHPIAQLMDGLVLVDGRVSLDYDRGFVELNVTNSQELIVEKINTGTNDLKIHFLYNWSGISIGTRVQAGVQMKPVGGFYGGVGVNINPGKVENSIRFDINFRPATTYLTKQSDVISSKTSKDYGLFDMRLYGGFQLLFVNFAVEYGIMSGALSATLYPLVLEF